MTRKPLPPISTRHLFWLGWKLAILLSISFCGYALLRLHYYSQPSSSLLQIYRARSLSFRDNFTGTPKLAFLFLVRRDIPLDFLWSSFFEGANGANFSIYIHSEPGFVFDESTTRSNFFYGRQLRDSIKVAWGESSMIEAERLLFAAALEDPANQRFVLLSDSCVPLYNFSYIYSYLMASPRSFIDSFFDEREGRFNPMMSPFIPRDRWRKGSQWITLVRKHAEVLVDDEDTIPVFKKFCKRRPPVDLSMGKLNTKLQKQHNCIPDEHYVQTLFAIKDLEGEVERRTVTYTVWNRSTTTMESQSWHPFTFGYGNAGAKQIQEIKRINHVYYESEDRTEWCRTNSSFVPCFLFGRKFSRGAAMRLLSEGVIGDFDAASLFDSITIT